MRSFCAVTLALVSLGCSSSPSSSAKPLGCSAIGSALTMDFSGDRVLFDDACTYEVTKHVGDAACAADDITINMTATVVAADPTRVKVGLVYTVTSPDWKGQATMDPTQLCSTGGYYAMTGGWSSHYYTTIAMPWPRPGELDELVPTLDREVDVRVVIPDSLAHGELNAQAHGQLRLSVSAPK